jgi:hypothetical protein
MTTQSKILFFNQIDNVSFNNWDIYKVIAGSYLSCLAKARVVIYLRHKKLITNP